MPLFQPSLVARDFARIRHGFILVLIAAMFAGCGQSEPSPQDITQFVSDYHQQVDRMLELKSVEKGEVVPQQDGAVKVSFTVHESFKQDAFLPISLEDAYNVYGHDPNLLDQATKKAMSLRMPERGEAMAARPQDGAPNQELFRRAIAAGEDFSWTGTVVARQGANNQWEFSDMVGKVEHSAITPETLVKDQLPKSAVIVDSTNDSNRLTQFIAEQNAFAKAVDAAEQRMIERLDREHMGLLGVIKNRDALLASIPIANSPNAKLSVRVAYQKNDGEEVVVLVEDTNDPIARACWQGKLVLSDPGTQRGMLLPNQTPDIDGWAIRMQNKGENPFRQMGVDTNMVLGWTQDGKVQWANLRQPVPLEKNPTPSNLPTYEEQVAKIREWTAPGQTWEGTYQIGSDPSHPIRVVFTEYQDNGSNVRLIVERPDEPFAVATFQGTVDTSPASVFAWPVHVTHSSGQGVDSKSISYPMPLISRSGGKLALAMIKDEECYGISNSSQILKLKRTSQPANIQPAVARWQEALKAGDRWSGKLVRGDGPAEKIMLTVEEVTDEGRTFRLTMQNPDNVRQFRPFVGTLDDSEKEIDGYALTITPTSMLGEMTRSGVDDGWWYIYGTRKEAKHALRLHSDGKTMLCLSRGAEQLTLTREPTPVARPLDRMSLAKDWRNLCQTGNRWRGTLTNMELKQSVEVDFAITSGVDNLGNVQAELSIAKSPNVKIPFAGTLQLDDAEVNGYALKLEKKEGGKATSLLFGPTTRGVTLNIRLAEDGKSLVGLGNSFSRIQEFAELAPVSGKP